MQKHGIWFVDDAPITGDMVNYSETRNMQRNTTNNNSILSFNWNFIFSFLIEN